MQYINTLREGQRISEIYLCKGKVDAKTKAGKSYYSLTLQDKTGTLSAKIWDLSSGIDHFEAMDYVKIDGDVTRYQNALQLNIRRLRRAAPGEYLPEDYLPRSPFDEDVMFAELTHFMGTVKNTYLHQLLEEFFVKDGQLAEAFKKHSAAKRVHHSFVGGLLQHTLGVVKICDFYARQYTMLNRDLLISAAMLHDIGKLYELADFPANDYTDEGQMLGHIVMGVEMVGEKAGGIEGFPAKTLVELKHCILAHHGEFEFGSPKKPAIAEALALYYADNADAKLEILTEIFSDQNVGDGWLGYNQLLESNIRRTGR